MVDNPLFSETIGDAKKRQNLKVLAPQRLCKTLAYNP